MNDAKFFSIIIPTVGRASLARAVESVLNQETRAEFQVIVVNDSGAPLFNAAWQNDARVQIIETPRVERSAARNAGARAARGSYLLFLDDDDWLLPNALEEFYKIAQREKSAWMMGDCFLVAPNGASLGTLQTDCEGNCAVQAITGEWFALQGSCLQRDLFFQAGEFGPLTFGEDTELSGRLAMRAELHRVHATVAGILCAANSSTTTRTLEQKARYAELRDALLDQPQSFARLKDSARNAYWRGRMTRLYWSASILNLKQKNFARAMARAVNGFRALATPQVLFDARSFWRGLTQPHASRVVH